MAKLPPFKRLIMEDFPSKYQDLLDKLLYGINQFFESVSNSLNKNISFEDNIACQVKELVLTAPITQAKPASFVNTLGRPCRGVLLINAENLSDANSPLTAAPFIQFTGAADQIVITNISGLTSGKQYRIKIICLP
jgi:hypothetical protein